MHKQPETVALRIYLVRYRRILQLLEDLSRANAPSLGFDGDEGWGVVVRLQDVGRVEVGGEVRGDELRVLTSGLHSIKSAHRHVQAGNGQSMMLSGRRVRRV